MNFLGETINDKKLERPKNRLQKGSKSISYSNVSQSSITKLALAKLNCHKATLTLF